MVNDNFNDKKLWASTIVKLFHTQYLSFLLEYGSDNFKFVDIIGSNEQIGAGSNL